MAQPMSDFGCSRCWPDAPEAAWDARRQYDRAAILIDESHFIVAVLRCTACDQHFVSIFTESIDWNGGNDPQYWTVMPLTKEEVGRLASLRDRLGEADLNALPSDRRSLQRNYPADAEQPTLAWGRGIHIGPHD